MSGVVLKPPHNRQPSRQQVQDRARLAEEVKVSLQTVRTNAESWRTGTAGLTALVTTILLFKGQSSIEPYETWVAVTLALLLLASLAIAVRSLWLFLSAAHGRVGVSSAQEILDEGGVDVHNVRRARQAVDDLKGARALALVAAALLVGAVGLSWFGPLDAKPSGLVEVKIASRAGDHVETLCGSLKGMNSRYLVLAIPGEPDTRREETSRLQSLRTVASCS